LTTLSVQRVRSLMEKTARMDGAFAAGLIGTVAMQFENLCVGEERDIEIHRFFRVAFEEEKRLDLRVGHW